MNERLEFLNKIYTYESFLVLDIHTTRIEPSEILLKGQEIRYILTTLLNHIDQRQDLKYQTLTNRLLSLEQMVYRVKDEQLIMTKFYNNIWEKPRVIDMCSEKFINMNYFLGIQPQRLSQISKLIGTHVIRKSLECTAQDNNELIDFN